MSERAHRVLPRVDATNEHFWRGGADGQLRVLRCAACGHWVHPPAPVCPVCLGRQVAPDVLSGRGVVHSFTVNHQPWNPTMPAPYVVALVQLEEQPGLRLVTNLVGVDPEQVAIGMAVEVTFEQYDDVWIPLFAPVAP